jgi:hypothetical protein
MHTSTSTLPARSLAEHAFAGLPGISHKLADRPLQTRRFALVVAGDPNPPLVLALHCRPDGQWYWEYVQHRFGQRQYLGVGDPFAVRPQAAQLHASAELAQEALLAVVQGTFPCRPGRLHEA